MGASASTMTITAMDRDTFQQFAPDHFSASMFNTLKESKENKIPPSRLLQFANNATDCFLTHDWGKDELNRDNHARVAKINAALKERGFRTWFDEEMMRGDIQQQMAEGIDHAACVVVFVTERYMEKVAGKGERGQLDNCLFEFSHISKSKDRNKVIPVVMEPRCRDTNAWIGKVNYFLGSQLYVDYCSDDNVTAVADDIIRKMRQVLTDGLNVVERWARFSTELTSSPIISPPKMTQSLFIFDNQTLNDAVKLWCSKNRSTAEEKYGHISTWNTSQVTDMSKLFFDQRTFNDNISNWDVSNVTNMSCMFMANCSSEFNGDLSRWNVGKVATMEKMFCGAVKFNCNLNEWDVRSVTNMASMFNGADKFNSDLNKWDVSNVTNMSSLFSSTTEFNGDITTWNVSKVTSMSWMFYRATKFNQDISKWEVSNVKSMICMFQNASSFAVDLRRWNVRANVKVTEMFLNASSFKKEYVEGWEAFSNAMFEEKENEYNSYDPYNY